MSKKYDFFNGVEVVQIWEGVVTPEDRIFYSLFEVLPPCAKVGDKVWLTSTQNEYFVESIRMAPCKLVGSCKIGYHWVYGMISLNRVGIMVSERYITFSETPPEDYKNLKCFQYAQKVKDASK